MTLRWTPAESPDEKLPVLFHVHGGGFTEAYSYAPTFYGDAFAQQGIVYVSIEYRLGILGFLAHPMLTEEAPYHASGNYGLLDQTAALKWVRRNIASFGGDPDRITINGQSAGAISCGYLMYSPMTDGDIAQGIFQSGLSFTNHKGMRFVGVRHDTTLEDGEAVGRQVFDALGVNTLEEARMVPWHRILEIQQAHPEWLFWPVIDGYHIPENLDDMILGKKGREIPVITGVTREEGIALGGTLQKIADEPESFRRELEDIYGSFAVDYLSYNGFDEDPAYIMNPGFMWEEFNAGTIAWCEEALRAGRKHPVYQYLFTRDVLGKHGGAGHSMDLWYSFGTLAYSRHPKEAEDYRLEKAMNQYFANFIKNGDPNGECLPVWTPYRKTDRRAMELGEHIGMIPNFASGRIQMLVDYILK